MKNRFLGLIMMATCACSIAMAQTVEENEMAVVYYMPQTQLAITIDYDKVTVEPGPFYLYAERYLGVKDVATEASTRYEVTKLHLSTRTVSEPCLQGSGRDTMVIADSRRLAIWLQCTCLHHTYRNGGRKNHQSR